VVVVDSVERRGQVRVQHPQPLRVLAAHRVEQGLDRVLAAPTRPKPIRFGFEPGLPFGFQCVTHPRLVAPVHDHGNAEWALLSVGLWYVHPLDRQGLPGGDGVVHAHRHLHPAGGSQRDLLVHPGGRAASIALRHLAHADQRVRPGSQRHLLQRPDLGPVLLLRRLEDPSPQPPYSAFVGAPVDGVPVGGLVLGSVHVQGARRHRWGGEGVSRHVSNLSFGFRRSLALVLQRLTCPRQQPFRSGPQVRYPASYPWAATWRCGRIARGFLSPFGHRHLLLGHPVPAGNSALLTVGLPGSTRTLTGFPRSARTRFGRGGCPLYPGTVVLSRPVDILQPAPAAFSSGQSSTPRTRPI